jgi:hypothetical protein
MTLFIEGERFSEETDASDPTIRRVEIRLRMALTEPTASAPPQTPALLEFVLDTAADCANVFPDDLVTSAISPNGSPAGWVDVILMDGSTTQLPLRNLTLWLYSNLPGLANQPYRIDPGSGVVVLPKPHPSVKTKVRSLLGMGPLLDAGLRIELNAHTRQFSIWVP